MIDLKPIKLGDVATFRNGLNFNKSSQGQKIKIIGVSDFKNRLTPNYDELDEVQIEGNLANEDYLHSGDIVFVRSNGNKDLVARSLFIDKDYELSFSGFCIKARIKDEKYLLRKYFSYFTKTSQFRYAISKGTIGTNINNLNQGILKDLIVPAPDIFNQQLIINFLSNLDSKIELNNRINQELEAMTKLIYDYWFVQFDFPISKEQAEAMGKPELEGKPYKASGGKMVYNQELKREIPEGWEVMPIKEHYNYLEGPGITKEKYTTMGHPFINIRCIQDDDLDVSNASMIKQEYIEGYSHFLLEEDDIVVSTSGTLGRSAIVRKEHVPLLLNTSVIRFRPRDDEAFEFMYLYLKSPYFIAKLNQLATGSIQKNFGPTHLDQMVDFLPPSEIIEKFHLVMKPIIAKIKSSKSENDKLSDLRDWLLPMLMNGQVTIKEAEDLIEDNNHNLAAEKKEGYGK